MMSEARKQILKMLQDGAISAEEANRLLAAVGDAPQESAAENAVLDTTLTDENADTVDDGHSAAERPGEKRKHDAADDGIPLADGEVVMPPDMGRFRRFWQIPFIIALGVLIISALAMSATYGGAGFLGMLSFVCAWSVFMVALLAAAIAFWSRTARWMHVRVQEKEGRRIAISLPVPVRLLGWGVHVARPFVDAETAVHLDTAAGFIEAMEDEMDSPGAEPLVVDVNDEDGDRVQVYFG